jgi:hypothetical protein
VTTSTSFEQLELDLPVMYDVSLIPEEERELAQGVETAGLYCSQCSSCTEQCQKDLEIPTFMRSYMYEPYLLILDEGTEPLLSQAAAAPARAVA